MPHVEMMRFVSSGTEATMSALRLARAATGRDLLLKFDGCYHGHGDSFLVRAGSGVATLGLPNSPGVPEALAALTLTAPFNDIAGARSDCSSASRRRSPRSSSSRSSATPDSSRPIRRSCRRCAGWPAEHGALLIFDEVMTGFRVALGGAAERFGVTPDLTTLGKVIGGGLPVAAYGGRRDLMQRVAPSGPVYQAGTLSGNPLAMAAGIATLTALTPGVHDGIARARARSWKGCAASRRGAACRSPRTARARCSASSSAPSRCASFADAKTADVELFRRFFHAALDRGVYLAPSAFEAGFMSSAHGDAEIALTLERLDAALLSAARRR